MWERALSGVATRVVDDQFGSPTCTVEVAAATWTLIGREASGTYHVANRGIASWYDVAAPIFAAAGALHLLTPCATADYPTPARRPAFSALDTGRLEREHGIVLPDWRDALGRFLGVLASATAKSEPGRR
jgi:dTDP-4-dehydrorhamnose reductase